MAVTVAVPAEAMRGRHSFGDDQLGAGREAPDRGPAQNQIAEMAVLLSNTRGSTILGGSVLSALTIGIAVEAAFSPTVLRPGLAGVVSVSLESMLRTRSVTSGAQRLAVLLLELADQRDSEVTLTQDELASLTGASRATVTRALSNWRQRGIIRTGQRDITITDLAALRKIAGQQP